MIKRNKTLLVNIDWWIVIIYIFMIFFGYMNLCSVSYEKAEKQFIWIILSIIFIFIVFLFKPIHYKYFSPLFFLFTLFLLIGVFFFGKNINGSKSWYVFGPISFQPSELSKISTSLMIARIMSQENIQKNKNTLLYISIIVILPTLFIFFQPDPGTSIVFSSFILTLYREGLSVIFIFYLLFLVFLFVLSLNISPWILVFFLFFIFILILFFKKKRTINDLLFSIFFFIIFSTFIFVSPFFYKKLLKKHHRDRINILFKNEFDKKYRENIGYNLLYSKTAIGSGKFFGKGYQKGTITKGKFVPEQHTDYIFCTVGEEWGFIGSFILIIFYLWFISRIYFLSERQKDIFGRIFGYSVGNIFFIHIILNLGMVMGLFPTIGIVFPFFSYGGSSIWSFTVLLFIFIRLDSSDQTSLI
ncbi:rod shape-determining protein RodA [Blattabacterium punctulatus]|uniref:rod shape-determining protein RodA n=1 Tax=Blattabacterium punctulatus TaxID=164514 RepID=UPI000D7C2089|nr:rod shape-determining protein RodA [Blattabacterium punctulatus]AWU42406.1 rod shape-determining protein RodA [Blattabacterium punctulatus]AWU42946.1 rod shape-determining protein RodA [Blattabacterium punctulatus]AWU44597.1 rod shape-determining protein RodA [Blattabacterium punctulatus]